MTQVWCHGAGAASSATGVADGKHGLGFGSIVAAEARPALESPPSAGVPLGLYLHIPFCRKRCHFCYFRVYTDKNAQEVE